MSPGSDWLLMGDLRQETESFHVYIFLQKRGHITSVLVSCLQLSLPVITWSKEIGLHVTVCHSGKVQRGV